MAFALSCSPPPALSIFKAATTKISTLRGRRIRMGVRWRVGEKHFICQSRTSRPFPWRQAQVISGEAEGNPSTEDLTVDEEKLQKELEVAVKEEDYERAASIRDRLQILHDNSKTAVLSANARFYQAFRNGDLAAMHSIWSKGDHIVVVHPGAGRICGYELVMGSWEIVCNADYEFPLQIDVKHVEVHVKGSMGYVTCLESFKTKGSTWGRQVATNVFEKIDEKWLMCSHHASHIDD